MLPSLIVSVEYPLNSACNLTFTSTNLMLILRPNRLMLAFQPHKTIDGSRNYWFNSSSNTNLLDLLEPHAGISYASTYHLQVGLTNGCSGAGEAQFLSFHDCRSRALNLGVKPNRVAQPRKLAPVCLPMPTRTHLWTCTEEASSIGG